MSMCWDSAVWLARSRASHAARLKAHLGAVNATAPDHDLVPARKRRAEARWAVDSSERTPRSSDDTQDSIAEWRAARAAGTNSPAEVRSTAGPSDDTPVRGVSLQRKASAGAILPRPVSDFGEFGDRRACAQEYPPHPDDISLAATAIVFFDRLLDALRGASKAV